MDLEQQLDCLTKKYEDRGFHQLFYLENGSLVCGDHDLVLDKPAIKVHEKQYYPKTADIPHGFCVYAITVRHEYQVFKGIFLLPEGLLSKKQVSIDLDRQLQLVNSYPQLFRQ